MKMEFTAEMIAGFLSGEVVGDKGATVHTVSSIEQGSEGSLAYLTNIKYEQFLYTTNASIVLVDKSFEPSQPVKATLVKVESAGVALLKLLELYNSARGRKSGISKMCSISEQATIGENLYIGDFAVIESGAKIGDNCQIYPQCYIGDDVTIGENAVIYPGVKIYHGVKIGNNCIIHAGAIIGADGFGFALKPNGEFDKIPQLGNVIIEDNVEIGANTCIDRAKTDSTIIRRGVKLDNLIQIAHNVEIGENTVSSAQLGIAGSSRIGKNCFIGGQVGVVDHVTIGDNCKVASKTGIMKSVEGNQTHCGFPSQPGLNFHRSMAVVKVLPELATTVRRLETEVAALKEK